MRIHEPVRWRRCQFPHECEARTYYRLFELYNLAVWPWHVLAVMLGLAVLVLWLRGGAWQGRSIVAILASCRLFVAWAYLLAHYDTINWAASYLAAGFALQAMLLGWAGVIRNWLSLRSSRDAGGVVGLCLFVFALFAWPLVSRLFGRPWLQAEIFGIAPDPTVVATLGVLIAADRTHWDVLIVPLLWCAISGATLWAMQSPDANAGRCAAGARSSLALQTMHLRLPAPSYVKASSIRQQAS